MNVIDIADVYKTFRTKGGRVDALRGLSLSIAKGEVFGFLGPNGAGKSTTIKILMGLISASAGRASILGHSVGSPDARQHVGYLPENPSFYDYLNAVEYLGFVAQTFGMQERQIVERTEEILRLLGLWDARKRPIRGYSKGMVQRLGLAQALVHDPEIFILDEPMSGLDPIGRALIKDVILDLKRQGKSVFFSTHITSDVEVLCDRVGILIKGELCRLERVDAILAEGIMGYQVGYKDSASSGRSDYYVPKDELPEFLKNLGDSGKEVVFVEPRRKDLESFFLNIVKGTTS